MKLSIYLLIASLLFCLGLTSCHTSGKMIKGETPSYSIVYNIAIPDTTKDDWELMAMDFDGGHKKNITNNEDVAWTYYAYKDRLFFISDRDTCYRCFFLYESDKNGSGVKKVSDLRLEDSWMSSRKNGKEMVVTGRIGKETRFQLFIINTENGSYRQITRDTSARYGDPCFSPDGKEIVVSYKKDKRDRNTHEELFILDDAGNFKRQITWYPEDNPSAKEYGYRAGASKWHPTENFISYVSKQNGRHSIFAVTPDGKKHWKLIHNPDAEGWHDWSRDGQWLVYNASDATESQFNIVLMHWKTKETKVLTDSEYKSQLAPVFVE